MEYKLLVNKLISVAEDRDRECALEVCGKCKSPSSDELTIDNYHISIGADVDQLMGRSSVEHKPIVNTRQLKSRSPSVVE